MMHKTMVSGALLVGLLAFAPQLPAQAPSGLDPSELLDPSQDSWPTYHGDYSGQRHSTLSAITPDNVHTLGLAWVFQTNPAQTIKATPIVHDGVMYLAAPDNLWALDARTGRQIWRYRYPQNAGFHIGHRGVAIHGDSVFLTTPDAHLLSIDARDGSLNWNVEIADSDRGFWSTNAPLIVGNHLLVGVSGDFDNLRGILKSFDPRSGEL
jgi:alcohol dehydrogenase (cytochrome c)